VCTYVCLRCGSWSVCFNPYPHHRHFESNKSDDSFDKLNVASTMSPTISRTNFFLFDKQECSCWLSNATSWTQGQQNNCQSNRQQVPCCFNLLLVWMGHKLASFLSYSILAKFFLCCLCLLILTLSFSCPLAFFLFLPLHVIVTIQGKTKVENCFVQQV